MDQDEFIRQGVEEGREAARESNCPNCGAGDPIEKFVGGSYRLQCSQCGYETFGHRFMMATEPYQYAPNKDASDAPPVPSSNQRRDEDA